MGKNNYDIDSILSEVKKHKSESAGETSNSQNKKENSDSAPETSKNVAKETEDKKAVEKKPKNSNRSEKIIPKEKTHQEKEIEKTDDLQDAVLPPVSDIQEDVKEVTIAPDDEDITDSDSSIIVAQEDAENEYNDEAAAEDLSDEPKGKKNKKKKKKEKNKEKKKGGKKKKIIISVILIILVVLIAGGGFYFYSNFLKPMNNAHEETNSTEPYKSTKDVLTESFDPITETDASEIASLEDMIRLWYYNGTPCSSSHVYNVLLVGEDTRGTEVLDSGTRADSAIVASVNVDTKTITLTSILRDSWAYFETTPGDESTGTFEKINGAMSKGDINAYINCVEKLYKINIDNYVIINFDAFEDVIDSLGGVTLNLTSAEIREINNHPKVYGNVEIEQTFSGTSGDIKLNGKQALAYCRIRHIDGDNVRADRQKTCLIEIFNNVKDSSNTETIKIIKSILPYMKTDMSTSAILNRASDAFSQGWSDYDIQMMSVPNYRINEKGMGGTYYGNWIWRPDYPQDAYYLQYILYGKSSITLAQTRVDVVNCTFKGFYSETAPAVSDTIDNSEGYGEESTTQIEKDEDEE